MDKIKTLRVASDKSISHRAIILSSVAEGKTFVKDFLFSEDTINTLNIFRQLGKDIQIENNNVIVNSYDRRLFEPNNVLNVGNSGTGIRLISGLLCGYDFLSILTGDETIRKRPMMRIIQPLSRMNARIFSRRNGLAPLVILGNPNLVAINYSMPIASAQVKSAILLAGLSSDENICIKEPVKSRDHTENMLKLFGVDLDINCNEICMKTKNRKLKSDMEIQIPADISSAAFFMVLSALKKDSEVLFKDIMANPTRSGILDIFEMCNINFEITNKRYMSGEPICDIVVKYSGDIKPFNINKDLIPKLIDEIPIISILALFADGISCIKGASELRVKESDRIGLMCENLRNLGIELEELNDGMCIKGKCRLHPSHIKTHFDHRIAMSFYILKAITNLNIEIDDSSSIKTSYPMFFKDLKYIMT